MPAMKHHPSLDAKAEMGFHGLKDLLTTREYLRHHCDFLTTCVHEAAWATRGAAFLCRRSVKDRQYLGLKRKEGATLAHPEVRYERAMFQKWSTDDSVPESGWHRVMDFQVPVSDRKASLLGLKAIDLLAVDNNCHPVVIELKIVRRQTSADSPLRALLEAASYACVLQADWPAFRIELSKATRPLAFHQVLPERLEKVPLVVAGPPEYWEFWNYGARSSIIEAKPAFRKMVEAFQREGFPVYFTSIEGSLTTPERLNAVRARFLDD